MSKIVSDEIVGKVTAIMAELERVEDEGRYDELAMRVSRQLLIVNQDVARVAIKMLPGKEQFHPSWHLFELTGLAEDEAHARRMLPLSCHASQEEGDSCLKVTRMMHDGQGPKALDHARNAPEDMRASLVGHVLAQSKDKKTREQCIAFLLAKTVEANEVEPGGSFEDVLAGAIDKILLQHTISQATGTEDVVARSIERLKRLISLKAPHSLLRNEALLLLRRGQFELALGTLARIKEFQPYPEDIQVSLALGLSMTGDVRMAKEVLARTTNPDSRCELLLELLVSKLLNQAFMD
ncbi:MAG: hypothetical protein ABIO72_06015 [Patescibacteria group bacterium]